MYTWNQVFSPRQHSYARHEFFVDPEPGFTVENDGIFMYGEIFSDSQEMALLFIQKPFHSHPRNLKMPFYETCEMAVQKKSQVFNTPGKTRM